MSDANSTEAQGDAGKQTPKAVPVNRQRVSSDNSPSNYTPVGSPTRPHLFLVPSPVVTRRSRTYSASRRAADGPVYRGTCHSFSQSLGHGFVTPSDSAESLFMHISDIDSEYIPQEGDELSYKLSPIPPKCEKYQAVEVRIIAMNLAAGKEHRRWEQTD